jgi:hypothetical protein
MENHINKIITEFQNKLQDIESQNNDILLRANKGIKLCQATLSKLKRIITTQNFEDMAAEIHFFKQIKHLPMSYLLYYKKVCSCETYVPKIGYKAKRKYLEQRMEMVNTFFSVNAVFVNYVRLQCSNMDACYFTRNFMDNDSSIETSDIYYDPEFNTMYDKLLAKVKANYMYMEYLNRKIGELYTTDIEPPTRKTLKKPLVFDRKIKDAAEMILGCYAMKVFKGAPSLPVITAAFENAFNIKISNIYKCKQEIKARKGEMIVFLEEMIYHLRRLLEDEDKLK